MKHLFFILLFLFIYSGSNAQVIWTEETRFRGKIGSYEIAMTLAVPYGGANSCFTIGEYYYLSKRKMLSLCSEDDERIIENVDGKETGYFIIKNWNKRIGQTVRGSWHTIDGRKTYPVQLTVTGKGKY